MALFDGFARWPATRIASSCAVFALVASVTAGCGSSSSSGAQSCAPILAFGQRDYRQIANVKFETGQEIGTARFADCGESEDGQEDAGRSVYEVRGLRSDLAIAGEAFGHMVFFGVQNEDGSVPSEVMKFVDASRSSPSQ